MIWREVDGVRGGECAVEDSEGRTGEEGRTPLEFEEQDGDFCGGKGVPGEGEDAVPGNSEELRRAWSEEDRVAVGGVERFDDVLRIMDEDQVPLAVPATTGMGAGGRVADQW